MVNTTNRIDGKPHSVRDLLSGRKYELDYYQRDYAWGRKHVAELLEDLEDKFRANYDETHDRSAVESYPHYFLGSVIISHKETRRFIVDGQQRLTSLTLLIIYLHHLSKNAAGIASLKDLIVSEKFGKRSFNIEVPEVPERQSAMDALFSGSEFDPASAPDSVKPLLARYADIEELFPDTLTGQTLPYFVDWLLENVSLIEITAYNDNDAYTIFETMNDRGLSLTPTDMLKGYLLANISGDREKAHADGIWRKSVERLVERTGNKDAAADVIKAWLRARYASSIRERKRDARPGDWDVIGIAFHKWVREHKKEMELLTSTAYAEFIHKHFAWYGHHYLTALEAARTLTPGWESVYYNAHNDFTLQYPLMLAPIKISDSEEVTYKKMRLVASFLDIYTARRIMNYKQIGYSAMSYTMFNLLREIRGLDVDELAETLVRRLEDQPQTFSGVSNYALHQMNRPQVRYILARLTAHAESECGIPSSFVDYVSRKITKPFEIEHIWADDYSRFADVFPSPQEFAEYRNRLGGLILLPRGVNQALGAGTYQEKLVAYFGQNLLAKSLSPSCYENNPSFLA